MNLSTGINLQKELNAIMRRVKKPKIHDKEECIFCCDDNYDDGYDYKNHEVYDLEDEDENVIKLTDRDDTSYRDIIQYKGFYTYASAPTGKEENKDKPLNGDMVTSKYIFGYKAVFEVNEGKLNFTARIIVDLEAKNITLALTFTPSFNFKGHLRCRFNDNPVDGTITLEAGKKKEVGMVVSTF